MGERFRVHDLAAAFGYQEDEGDPERLVVFEEPVRVEGDFVMGSKIVTQQVNPPSASHYAEQAGAFPSEPAAGKEPGDPRQLPSGRIVRGELAE